MKVLVLTIFVSICGLFLGLAGMIFDWQFAKTIGIGSGLVLAFVFWLEPSFANKTSDRFLPGRKRQD